MENFAEIGNAFAQQFYHTFDANRANLIALYRPDSMLTFEGAQVQGSSAIVEKLVKLPFKTVRHIITATDSQPTGIGILVCVLGQLKTDEDPPHSFCEVFQLKAEGSNYYIFNEIFRLGIHHS